MPVHWDKDKLSAFVCNRGREFRISFSNCELYFNEM